MKRSHRTWHAWIWRLLGPAVLIAAAIGLQAKQDTPIEDQQPGKVENAILPADTGDAS